MHPSSLHRRRWLVRWLTLAVVLGLLTAVVAVVSRPALPETALGRQLLLRDIYKTASAASLPGSNGATLWQVTGQHISGPQEKLCTNYSGPAYGPSKDVYFKDGATTAWYSLGGYPSALPIMRYSQYAEAPAFYADAFKGIESEYVRTMLADAVLTDADGKDLSPTAAVESKTAGNYELYARINVDPQNYKGYVKDCSQLRLKVTVDAASGLYKEIAVYRNTISQDNLSFSETQQIQASRMSFEEALPVLQSYGFDLEKAKLESRRSTYAYLTNSEAGFELSYVPSVLGTPKLVETRNSQGRVTEYTYTFSAQPRVRTVIRTADSTAEPRTADDLRTRAKQRGWKITTDGTGDGSNVPGCKAGDKEWYFGSEDDTMEYNLFARTCGPFPSVYTEMPKELRIKSVDAIAGVPIESTPIAGFSHFAPGTAPQRMH